MDKEKQDQQSSFKVVDKRRFGDDGQLTSEASAVEQINTNRTDPSESKSKEEHHASSNQTNEGMPVDFPSFVISLATQSLVMLGEVPHPEYQQIMVNLPAAKQTIDILEMIETKTKGNLTSEEEKLLEDVLASVRMAYVRKMQNS